MATKAHAELALLEFKEGIPLVAARKLQEPPAERPRSGGASWIDRD